MGMGRASNLSRKGPCSAHQVVTLVDISFVDFLITSERLLASMMWGLILAFLGIPVDGLCSRG